MENLLSLKAAFGLENFFSRLVLIQAHKVPPFLQQTTDKSKCPYHKLTDLTHKGKASLKNKAIELVQKCKMDFFPLKYWAQVP